jgi:GT2 family glycosyltransferase
LSRVGHSPAIGLDFLAPLWQRPPQPPRRTAQKRIGVVILSYGTGNTYEPLLRALTEVESPSALSIVVVHNPSEPVSVWAPTAMPGAHLLSLPENVGYAGGMNAGARFLLKRDLPEWLLFLTHDARIEHLCIGELVAVADSRPSVAVVGPTLLLGDGSVWSTGVRFNKGRPRHCQDLGPRSFVPRDSIDGTAMLVRTRAYREVGPFDERFFMYWEETEFCWRARTHGWRVGVAANTSATTVPGGHGRPAAHAYLLTRNGMEFARRANGCAGLLAFSSFVANQAWNALPWPLKTEGREWRAWLVTLLRMVGILVGAVAFALRRWGPPPRLLMMADRSRLVR